MSRGLGDVYKRQGFCSTGFCLFEQEAKEATAATPAKGKNKFGCNFSINTNLYKIVSAKIEDSHLFNFHKLPFNFQ